MRVCGDGSAGEITIHDQAIVGLRWVDGPQVARSPWLRNGSSVQVFYIAGDWAVTSRGYIRTEWLEVDPV